MIPTATCRYCGWQGPADRCGPLENAWERVQPGDPMPAGACPKCYASALLDEPGPSLRIVTTREPERATHVPSRSVAQALARIMALAGHASSYRVQHIEDAGFRVAVYHASAYPRMVPDGHLRIVTASDRGGTRCISPTSASTRS